MPITEISSTPSRHLWASVSGAIDAAAAFANLTTFGASTVTVGGLVQRPTWAQSVSGLLFTGIHDHTSTTGGISGLRVRGSPPANHYFLGCGWGGQTTVSVSATVNPLKLNPMLAVTASLGLDGTAGVGDPGNGDATCSIRWDAAGPATRMRWLAAMADSTAATDTLSDALTTIGGDTTFPVNAEGNIRAVGICQSSDSAAAGDSIGQYRIQGSGLRDNPQDLAGIGHGGEGGATSGFGLPAVYWDDWIETNIGSPISLLAGYTGTDSGTESLGIGLGFQL